MSQPLGDNGLLDAVRELGLDPTRVLGSGMEDTVIGLADGTLLKVWSSRSADGLHLLQSFYSAVEQAGCRLHVPQIIEVLETPHGLASRQLRLEGAPLWQDPGVSPPSDDRHVEAVVDVLAALAEVDPVPALAVLPVLEGEGPFDSTGSFPHALAALTERKVAAHERPLRVRMTDLDDVVAAVTHQLRGLDPARPRLLHGDLVPGNILVRDGLPTAVLDFGFLSTLGDPAFDAAVAASVYDMYGPDAARSEVRLDEAIRDRFRYDEARMNLYRAAYALVTANCFSHSGSDGHFEWCMRMLERPVITELLGRRALAFVARGSGEPLAP